MDHKLHTYTMNDDATATMPRDAKHLLEITHTWDAEAVPTGSKSAVECNLGCLFLKSSRPWRSDSDETERSSKTEKHELAPITKPAARLHNRQRKISNKLLVATAGSRGRNLTRTAVGPGLLLRTFTQKDHYQWAQQTTVSPEGSHISSYQKLDTKQMIVRPGTFFGVHSGEV